MSVQFSLDREAFSALIGIGVMLFVFVTVMWFPSVLVGALWALLMLVLASVAGGAAALGIFNLLSVGNDEEDDEESE